MNAEDFLSKYKKGDFVVIDHFIVIFDRLEQTVGHNIHVIYFHAIYSYFTSCLSANTMGAYTGIGNIEGYNYDQVRPATNKEKKTLLKAMHVRRHLRWNERTMCVESEL
jgi:hypothetical protein